MTQFGGKSKKVIHSDTCGFLSIVDLISAMKALLGLQRGVTENTFLHGSIRELT